MKMNKLMKMNKTETVETLTQTTSGEGHVKLQTATRYNHTTESILQ